MFLEGGNVRVAEHRKAVGPQFDALADGIEAGTHGLVRQPVDQIEIDAADAGSPQTFGRGGGHRKALHPVDGALHGRIETLHAEARPVDPAIGQRLDHLARQPAGIDLDGDFG